MTNKTFDVDSSSGWAVVTSQREAVKLCPQFSAPSPPVWESWTWVTTTCRIQEWSCCLLDWRVVIVNWKLSGQDTAACWSVKSWFRFMLVQKFNIWRIFLLLLEFLIFFYLQSVRLSDHRGRLFFSGLSSELQPLPSERAGPELQPSRRQGSEAAVCWTGGSTLETGHSQVWTDNRSSHSVGLQFTEVILFLEDGLTTILAFCSWVFMISLKTV